MKLERVVSRVLRENIYIFCDEKTGAAAVIDPGCGAADVLAAAKRMNARITAILLTHGHFDHVGAVNELAKASGAPVFAHEAERALLGDPAANHSFKLPGMVSITPDRFVKDGDEIPVGGEVLRVIFTPGHTAGGVCYYNAANGILFSGDTLFFETIGRADFETSNYADELRSVKYKLYALPDETVVYPGHERPTTIGHEKTHNDCRRDIDRA